MTGGLLAPPALRSAATALIGPAPDPHTPRCGVCRAPSGQPCRWRRPSGEQVHRTRAAALTGWRAAYTALVDAVAAHAASVAAGRPSVQLGQRAAVRHRALVRRADAAGAPTPALPRPDAVLTAAGARPG